MSHLNIFFQITVCMSGVMALAWLWQRAVNRAEIVDICWTFGVGAAGVWCAVALDGDPQRRLLLGFITGIWSLRLGLHLVRDRMFTREEDGRYQDLRALWGGEAQRRFFLFFQLQAFIVPFLATAFYAVGQNTTELSYFDFIAVFLFVLSVVGEAIADAELYSFRRNPLNDGGICKIGLWKYSRHPNYFFEWIHWLSYPLMAFSGQYWLLSLVSPALMYYLIRYVTGVPATEQRMLERRGEKFKEYQKHTSEFWPWIQSK